ncbi:hypothetical protein X777_10300, partial [Ooceraea biroi]
SNTSSELSHNSSLHEEEVVRLYDSDGHVWYIYDISIRNFICDAPARPFVKCTIGHNGLFSCEKCEVQDEWYHNRIVYLNNGQKRTDHLLTACAQSLRYFD